MKENRKSFFQILATCSMCFFSLFSVAAAALAWFWANKRVSSDFEIKANKEDLHAKFFVYKYTKDYNGDGTDRDDDTDEVLSVTSFTLNTYDTIFTQQNKYTPALIRIHLYGQDLPDASIDNNKTITIRINRNSSFTENNPEEEPIPETLYKCITSVADFSCDTIANYSSYIAGDDLDNISNVSSFFNATIKHFQDSIKDNSITPTNFIRDAETKENYIDLNFSYSSTTKIDNVNHVNFFIYVDYNLELIENFTDNANSGGLTTDFLGQVDTQLENDLTSIIVSVEN